MKKKKKKERKRKAAIDSQSQERKVLLTDNIESRSWNGVFFLSGNGWVLFFYSHQMWPKPSPTLTCPYLKLTVSGIDETSCSNMNFWGVEFLAQMNLSVLLSTLKKGLAASLPSARSAILTAQRKLSLIFKLGVLFHQPKKKSARYKSVFSQISPQNAPRTHRTEAATYPGTF